MIMEIKLERIDKNFQIKLKFVSNHIGERVKFKNIRWIFKNIGGSIEDYWNKSLAMYT